ncbi:hypothetical protein [Propionispora vibrioides]|uniref:DUF481 domain-containing protein n=1 Tax=Propionispora vibrioides TaxID=112903 RepID=A0A1H8PM74_9FIRM|nr:hypothetical protein [Propionispora vibrioides]SEO43015.1 hypothetical protein SAMN04490178_10221 [Propionispora vibrioides]
MLYATLLTASFTLAALTLATAPAAAAQSEIYGGFQTFRWQETDSTGAELMHETGQLFTLGTAFHSGGRQVLNTTALEVFGGSPTHYETNGSSADHYHGFSLERRWEQTVSPGKPAPFAGLGWKQWSRSIDSSPGYYGYTESWKSLYGKAGIRQEHGPLYWVAGVKAPLHISNEVDFIDTTFTPRKTLGYFAEIGTAGKDKKISLTYEYQKYKASATVDGYYQPDSSERLLTLRAVFTL